MIRKHSRFRLSTWSGAMLVAGATLLGGCVVAAPPGAVVVRPPVAISVQLVRPGWDYVQVGGAWYYAPRGAHHRRHVRHNVYAWRGGAWVFIR